MLFVALLSPLPGALDDCVARRMKKPALEGAKIVAEYWLQSPNPTVIFVLEADHITQLWAVFWDWHDLVDISIYPAVGAQEGFEYLNQMIEERS